MGGAVSAHLHEIEQLISRVPIFSALAPDQVAQLATRVRPRHYAAGEQLYGAGERNPSLYVIHTGRVKVTRLSESGREQVVRVLGPGDFLGEASVLTGEPMDHFAVTVEAGEICSLHPRDLRDHLLSTPSVAVTMLATLSRRLGSTEEQLRAVTGDSAGRRVADYLLRLTADAGRSTVRLPVAKKDVASQLGITPETLSRKLTQLEDAGLVRLDGSSIQVLDEAALRAAER